MSDVVRAEELRAWAESRGLTVSRQGKLPEALVRGWNKAHPDRPYKTLQHGSVGRRQAGCSCTPCLDAYNAYQRDRRYANADPL